MTPRTPRLVVGLGNPGFEYTGTRHNVGFRVLDLYARDHRLRFRRSPYEGHAVEQPGGPWLLKPVTFMNLSGRSVRVAMKSLRLGPEEVLVICDDLDLPLGKVRLRLQGGHGGHNGLRSVITEIGSDAFPRLRVGIGRPPDDDVVRFVLGTPYGAEAIGLRQGEDTALRCLTSALSDGVEAAMNIYNALGPPA